MVETFTRSDLAELAGAVAGTVLNAMPKEEPEPSALQAELSERRAADKKLQGALLDIDDQLCVLKDWLTLLELAVRSPEYSGDDGEGHRCAALVGFDAASDHLTEIREAMRALRKPPPVGGTEVDHSSAGAEVAP